jgi:hypothetical protein
VLLLFIVRSTSLYWGPGGEAGLCLLTRPVGD